MTQAAKAGDHGSYYGDFRLSITKALGDQLTAALGGLGRVPLTEPNLANLAERPGVYRLYLKDDFVYVGKADVTLPGRLRNHLRKLSGRRGIDLNDVSFSCLYVDEDFSALALERLLINQYRGTGSIPWNTNGFGNNDPGRRRDSTILGENHFDVMYQIDLSKTINDIGPGEFSLFNFLRIIKSRLPYGFRYDEPPGSRLKMVASPAVHLSADEAFRIVAAAIPDSWQITALMGYVIMYEDSPSEYGSARRYYRSEEVVEAVPRSSVEGLGEDGDIDIDE